MVETEPYGGWERLGSTGSSGKVPSGPGRSGRKEESLFNFRLVYKRGLWGEKPLVGRGRDRSASALKPDPPPWTSCVCFPQTKFSIPSIRVCCVHPLLPPLVGIHTRAHSSLGKSHRRRKRVYTRARGKAERET